MKRVLVVQATRHQADISPARAYGDITFVLTSADRTSADYESTMAKLRAMLRNFDPDNDYILWSGGDPLSLMLLGALMRDHNFYTFTYLRYEKPDARNPQSAPFYVPVTVTLD